MIEPKKIGRAIALAVLFGVVLYAIVYFMASHSEAFEFVEKKIRNSQAVKAQVGEIKEIRPALLGPYDQKTVNSDEWVSMVIDVSGTAKSIELDVRMKKTNGIWAVESAKRDGQNFSVD